LAEDYDTILEHEVRKSKPQFKTQHTTWQQILHDHEEKAGQLLKQQKDETAALQQKDPQEARNLLDK